VTRDLCSSLCAKPRAATDTLTGRAHGDSLMHGEDDLKNALTPAEREAAIQVVKGQNWELREGGGGRTGPSCFLCVCAMKSICGSG